MGIGFVLIVHLIVIGILSGLIAAVVSLITFFGSKKENRNRNMLTALISPFVGLYTLYVCGLVGSCIVSTMKDVDIGIGDEWYVPLPDGCQLFFIDIPDQAYLEKDGQTVISGVSQVQQVGEKILGKTGNNRYFAFNTATNDLKQFETMHELEMNSAIKLDLSSAIDFYSQRRDEVAGSAFIVVGLTSLLVSIAAMYLVRKVTKPRVKNT